jgi:hypothetical protein
LLIFDDSPPASTHVIGNEFMTCMAEVIAPSTEADPRAFAVQAFEFLDLPVVDEIDYGQRMSVLSKSRWPLAGAMTKLGANTLRELGWVRLLGQLKSNPRFRSLFYRPFESSDKPQVDADSRKRPAIFLRPKSTLWKPCWAETCPTGGSRLYSHHHEVFMDNIQQIRHAAQAAERHSADLEVKQLAQAVISLSRLCDETMKVAKEALELASRVEKRARR